MEGGVAHAMGGSARTTGSLPNAAVKKYLCWETVLNVKCKTIRTTEGSTERLCGRGVRKDSSNKFQTHKRKICISLNCFF